MATNDRPVKCPACGETFRRSAGEYVLYKKRYYHKECYEKSISKQETSGVQKDELFSYICKLYKIDYPSPRMMQQMNSFVEKYNYTYKGIELTLYYFYELNKNSLEKANGGIGIVPYVYGDARDFFARKLRAEQSFKNHADESLVEIKKVVIHPPKPKGDKKDSNIDISSL